jgi:hypothetical protein
MLTTSPIEPGGALRLNQHTATTKYAHHGVGSIGVSIHDFVVIARSIVLATFIVLKRLGLGKRKIGELDVEFEPTDLRPMSTCFQSNPKPGS